MWLSGPNAGQVTNVLHPISAEFEELYSRPSVGSLVLATKDPAQEDVWPDTGLYISQVMPDGSRRARFGGYFPKNSASGGGALGITVESIDTFLNQRLMAGPDSPYRFESGRVISIPPTNSFVGIVVTKPTGPSTYALVTETTDRAVRSAVPVFLVNFARGNIEGEGFTGAPILTAVWEQPSVVDTAAAWVEQTQEWWDVKSVGQMIREAVEAVDGPKYYPEHIYSNGYWSTVLHFADSIGTERDYTLQSDREGWQYGLEVDGSERASRLYGIGAGEESNTMFAIAYDAGRDPNYPERQVSVAWKDQTIQANLNASTTGYVADHRDPTTVPSMTVVGLPDYDPDTAGFDPQKGFPAPEICRPGDTFNVDIGYGAATVRGIRVRNLGVSWSLKQGTPVERTIAMQPVERPSVSVRLQTPAVPPSPEGPVPVTTPKPGTADPWPTPGRLVNVTGNVLAEISGMEASIKNPNHVWVHNDEQQTPQVHLVSLKDGHTAATFTPNPGASAAPVGDPEAIRISRVSGRLVLADIGDNAKTRPTSGANQPHLLAVAEPKGAGAKGKIAATKYPIAYPGGEKINAETLLIHPTTDEVFIVSKEPTRARVFSFGALSAMSTANNVGTLVATLAIKNVSDGTHTYAGNFIILMEAGRTLVRVFKSNWGYGGTINIPAMAKAEAIAVRDTCSFVVTTEGPNPPIYQVLIPKTFGATCTTPAGPSGGGGTPSNPNAVVPGQLIDMSNWKLQLPI